MSQPDAGPLPLPADFSFLDFVTQSQIAALHSCQFSRAVSGWVRLFLLVAFCLCPGEGCKLPDSSRISPFSGFGRTFLSSLVLGLASASLTISWIFLLGHLDQQGSIGSPIGSISHMLAEQRRAAQRFGNQLQADRVILVDFDRWLA